MPVPPAPPPLPLPPAPIVTAAPAFDAAATGRAALCDNLWALMTARRLSFRETYHFVRVDDKGNREAHAGTETLFLDRAARRLSFVLTSADGKPAARYVAGGGTLLASRRDKDKSTFFQIPFGGDTRTVGDALTLAGARDVFMDSAARVALFGQIGDGSLRASGTVYSDADGAVIEALPPHDENGHAIQYIRRYRFAPATHLPVERGEWTTDQAPGKPATVRQYWVETYTPIPFPTASAAFVAKPAPGSAETAPPSGLRVPEPPNLSDAPPRARALLNRWEHAWARLTSLSAQVRIVEGDRAQTAGSPVPEGEERAATLFVSYLRPGKIVVSGEPAPLPSNAYTAGQTGVSDGRNVAVYEGPKRAIKRGQTETPSDDNALHDALRNVGFYDFSEVLPRLLEDPQQMLGYGETAVYRGALPLPGGGAAEAVTITQALTVDGPRRKGRSTGPTEFTQVITVYFDSATGLPLRSEFVRHFEGGVSKAMARDLPPDQFRVADFSDVRVNEAPAEGTFDLPKTP